MESPKTLAEAIIYFANPDNSLQYLAAKRWPKGVTCPYCDAKEPMFLSTRRIWKCRATKCRKQFSVKVGTILNESPIGLDKWLPVMWLVANCRNGVSSCEIARDLGVTQKTAWFMLHRVREAMQDKSATKLSGEVEVNESFIGGKARNMHRVKRERVITGNSGRDKAIAIGMVERGGNVRTAVVPTRRKRELQRQVRENVQAGSARFTDFLLSYEGLVPEYRHKVVDHAVEYVRGNVHNQHDGELLESRKTPASRHVHQHGAVPSVPISRRTIVPLQRTQTDGRREVRYRVLSVAGRRLTWDRLTGKDQPE